MEFILRSGLGNCGVNGLLLKLLSFRATRNRIDCSVGYPGSLSTWEWTLGLLKRAELRRRSLIGCSMSFSGICFFLDTKLVLNKLSKAEWRKQRLSDIVIRAKQGLYRYLERVNVVRVVLV